MRTKLSSVAFAAFALCSTPALAGWQDQATETDARRLARLDEARSAGLNQAQGGGDMAAINAALGPSPRGADGGEFLGTWRCRQMKLGGVTPSIVYKWFTCRISNRGGHLYFEKVSGTQRTRGWLYPDGGSLVYLGASSAKGDGASLGAMQTPDDQIGRLSLIGSGHARLELPYPVQESTFDVIELRR